LGCPSGQMNSFSSSAVFRYPSKVLRLFLNWSARCTFTGFQYRTFLMVRRTVTRPLRQVSFPVEKKLRQIVLSDSVASGVRLGLSDLFSLRYATSSPFRSKSAIFSSGT